MEKRMTIDQHLEAVIKWSEERLRTGAEPPFIYYRLMQLRESAKELYDPSRQRSEDLPECAENQETALQQAAGGHLPNIVPLRSSAIDLP
ncbi:MAG: hypothetical protein CMK07_04985 [Ponticaulis sp.]|nr:hypothetical protein [Ponticaulis sp.]